MHTYEVYRSGNPDHPPFVVQIVFRATGDAVPVRADLSQHTHLAAALGAKARYEAADKRRAGRKVR